MIHVVFIIYMECQVFLEALLVLSQFTWNMIHCLKGLLEIEVNYTKHGTNSLQY